MEIIKTVQFAAGRHIEQKRFDGKVEGGSPYINHPVNVAARIYDINKFRRLLPDQNKRNKLIFQ